MTSAFHAAERKARGKQLAVCATGTFTPPNNIWILLGKEETRSQAVCHTKHVKINKKQSLPPGSLQSREKKHI